MKIGDDGQKTLNQLKQRDNSFDSDDKTPLITPRAVGIQQQQQSSKLSNYQR